MTAVLGVSAFFHDAAAALLVDGELVAAAEEERFSRRKHDPRFPRRAIRFCLEQAGLGPGDLDYAVFYEKPIVKLERGLITVLAAAPRTFDPFVRLLSRGRSRLTIRDLIREETGLPPERVLFVDHHLSHAASAFFASPFERAAVVTADGVGEWATAGLGEGRAAWDGEGPSSLELRRELRFPHSVGLLYSAFTEFLGFEVNDGEYKVMGLAAYGRPRHADRLARVARLYEDGSVWLDMRYFSYHRSTRTGFDPRLPGLLGVPPRPRGATFELAAGRPAGTREQAWADVAATVQAFTEEAVVAMVREAIRLTGQTDVCLAGGVALNGVANARVLERSGARRVFIPPAPGDAGGALGAALYTHHVLLGQRRRFVMHHAYWGARYPCDRVAEALRRAGLAAHRHPTTERLVEDVAGQLAGGRVVAWLQGRFEWGPRALGNRSILADPRSAGMKEAINRVVKFREPFRPFAPAMLEECARSYVEGAGAEQWPARFMLLVLPLQTDFARQVPAVDHFGTGRVQTVAAPWNPGFHALLSGFRDRTGLGCLLNTSFNLAGEPMVASPEDAISTFMRSGLDTLVLEDHVVSRR